MEANSPTTENDTLFGPGQATLIAYGGNPHWYESDTSQTVLATGDTLITPELEITTTFYVEDVIATDSEERTLGMPTHFGNDYSSNIYNGETFFNCNTHLTLNTVKVYTDQPGLRIIELKDADGNVLQTHEADLQGLGTYILELNFAIPPGEGYVLTTNTENNNAVFGFNSPRLKRNNEGVSYPYQVDEIIEITGSNLGEEFYYYFYDWKVSPEAIACNSERVPVQAVLILDATSEPAETIGIEVYPNPSKGVVQVTWPEHLQNLLNISIMDGVGKKVMLKESLTQNHQEFYLGHLAKGLYYVQFEIDGKMYYSKIVLQ